MPLTNAPKNFIPVDCGDWNAPDPPPGNRFVQSVRHQTKCATCGHRISKGKSAYRLEAPFGEAFVHPSCPAPKWESGPYFFRAYGQRYEKLGECTRCFGVIYPGWVCVLGPGLMSYHAECATEDFENDGVSYVSPLTARIIGPDGSISDRRWWRKTG